MGGSTSDACFYALVARLDAHFDGMKGRVRSGVAQPNVAGGQHRKHARWCPPGFEAVRAITDDMLALFEAARRVRHPMAHPEAALTPDLEAAIKRACDLGHGVAGYRAAKWEVFAQISKELRPWSALVLARQPEHGRREARILPSLLPWGS